MEYSDQHPGPTSWSPPQSVALPHRRRTVCPGGALGMPLRQQRFIAKPVQPLLRHLRRTRRVSQHRSHPQGTAHHKTPHHLFRRSGLWRSASRATPSPHARLCPPGSRLRSAARPPQRQCAPHQVLPAKPPRSMIFRLRITHLLGKSMPHLFTFAYSRIMVIVVSVFIFCTCLRPHHKAGLPNRSPAIVGVRNQTYVL